MDKSLALKRLTPLVIEGDPKWEALVTYLEFLEDESLASLRTCKDIRQINILQGKLEVYNHMLHELPKQIRQQ